MSAIGGSILSLSLQGRQFSVTADADIAMKLGGFENELQMNGDGTERQIKTRVPSQLGDVTVSIDDVNGDLEFLQSIADSNELVDGAIELASGAIWVGRLTITGELIKQTNATTASFTLQGTKLKQQ